MNILIIYAHPEPKSFNGALKDLAVSELTSLGHQVKVSDLYAMNFKAVADSNDFIQLKNKEFLKYAVEQKHATKTNNFSADIQEEQEKLLWADFVIFQFPLWWYSVPAILKGWFDRVFASGFIYSRDERYDTGRLKGRKAMLSTTTGSPKHAYTPYGMDGDMHEKILYHINHGMLYFSGLEPVEPFIAWTPSHNKEDREQYLEEYKKRLHNISDIPSISYHPSSHYDEIHQLKTEYR
ncbi:MULTISPECIES: NAD(P)H-dependent oxidoreductase [Bacillus]|uniref:NAD(P)H dehydrogenase (Quinone) n=1 Tax=Bacillus mycoides TaxID=1405 RepID=A0A3D9VQV9_BACMY|nr:MULTISPECIES: NAD(P)H-dependent oxidoreductase [Bacillus]RBP30148.1 NAD(P)H dehydrogenase (quinone) [Bacillus sp. DB-2]REF39791.1 NAD(P)H dehydrogenase (quinone) [Bacillus mycoides]